MSFIIFQFEINQFIQLKRKREAQIEIKANEWADDFVYDI